MGKPAARIGDFHTCPAMDGPKPHGGGPVLGPGVPTVLIGNKAAATIGDTAGCAGLPDIITAGAGSVLIGNKPAARLGDPTAHGGVITAGETSVLIGNSGASVSGQTGVFHYAAHSGRPFCALCEETR